ncbi:hypothetical protein PAI11_35810 [Patulibacter medicamentivorans]|uniref:Uncharacterized protein n=1 Tax=Patulibacter medicamentivorans TaxID=1097667 RepID=H0E9R1_9ACTN|nr:hypothetical protein [Patulibacter medicamentivorans]EHN09605.1 hypothetical protein PAI11_35810 [Patulibacter medicamentivorans]
MAEPTIIDATDTLPPGWLDGRSWAAGPEVAISYRDPAAGPARAPGDVDALLWGGSLDDGTVIAQITWGTGSISARWRPATGYRCEETISGSAAPSGHRADINQTWSAFLRINAEADQRVREEFRRRGWPYP